MAGVSEITWRGMREYKKRMRDANKVIAKNMRLDLRKAGKLLRKETKKEIRGQGLVKTGNLWRSIGMRVRARGKGKAGGYVVVKPRITGKSRGAHGHLIEFGTNERRTKTGASRGAVKARPFLSKTVARVNPEVFRILGKVFRGV